LLTIAQDSEVDVGTRGYVVYTLGWLGRANKAVLNDLVALAQDPQIDRGMRILAVESLGRFGHANEAILKGLLALAWDSDVDVQEFAYYSLKKCLLSVES
jgi:hypothetical protein